MPYAVWIRKGEEAGLNKYKVDGMPELPCNVAVPITKEQVIVAKHLMGVHVFEEVQGIDTKEVEEKHIEYKGKTYHYRDGMFDPPVDERIFEEMKEEGLI